MIVVVRDLVQEGPGLQDEGRKHHFAKIHAWPDLLHQEPDDGLVLVAQLLSLVTRGAEHLKCEIILK